VKPLGDLLIKLFISKVYLFDIIDWILSAMTQGGKFHLNLNKFLRPIPNKYCEGKVKRS